jgi:hypothetical protein
MRTTVTKMNLVDEIKTGKTVIITTEDKWQHIIRMERGCLVHTKKRDGSYWSNIVFEDQYVTEKFVKQNREKVTHIFEDK